MMTTMSDTEKAMWENYFTLLAAAGAGAAGGSAEEVRTWH